LPSVFSETPNIRRGIACAIEGWADEKQLGSQAVQDLDKLWLYHSHPARKHVLKTKQNQIGIIHAKIFLFMVAKPATSIWDKHSFSSKLYFLRQILQNIVTKSFERQTQLSLDDYSEYLRRQLSKS